MAQSLYEKYGGFAVINEIVSNFYDKVEESELLKPWFENVDMAGLINHQTQFLCMTLGGPVNYDGQSIEDAHRGHAITKEAFGEVAELLEEALDEGGVEPDDVKTILGVVQGLADKIITA